jgi:hypothetical protein
MSIESNVLNNLGGVTDNSLVSIIAENDIVIDEEPDLLTHSSYFSTEMFIELIKKMDNVFKCLSLNIQSLNAKIEQLRIYTHLLKQHEISLDMILLQETWLSSEHDTSLLQLDGYDLITQPYEITKHGGLAMYIRQGLEYNVTQITRSQSGTWEGQFLNMKFHENKHLTIGNIYRPPRDLIDSHNNFRTEFEECLACFAGDVLIGGDFNIDFLKITERSIYNEFFETVLSSGFIPKITLPTRLTRTQGSLIDNFLCRISENSLNSTAGILMHKISDHQPIFVCLNSLTHKVKCPKYVNIVKKSEKDIENFRQFLQRELAQCKFCDNVATDPNINYDKLYEIMKLGMKTCMPSTTAKYSKHKHKNNKWITAGLLNSIKFRDKLYLKLKRTPHDNPLYDQLKINLGTYNKILKKAIREAKKSYYHHCFEMYKNDIKKHGAPLRIS